MKNKRKYRPMAIKYEIQSIKNVQNTGRERRFARIFEQEPSPGIIVTPLALDEFYGPRGDFYKNMFAKCPAGRPGTADEVANVAELLMSSKGAFITGSDFLIDGGATASYFYGPLKPAK